jgi:hypothetical protein
MKNLFACLMLVASTATYSQNITEVDICVYGGTSAGVMAAYTAKSAGKSVLLIEPGKHLGGLTTGGLGYTDIGNKYAVTGLARDFYRRIGQHYGKFEQWIFEPHVAEELFNEYIRKAQVNVLYDHALVDVQKDSSGYIKQIVVSDKIVRARMFIDCSYEGDLMARAGVSYIVGREDNNNYHETYNGVQVRDKHQFPEGIDPYKIPGKPESGLLWGISPDVLPAMGSGDKRVQAYNFRICLSDDPLNLIPITKPDKYDSSKYELLVRLFQKQPDRPFNQILKPDMMPNHKTDINNNGPFSTDMIGMNYDYPEASYDRRKEIIKEHELYTKGLLYFIGHSPRIPEQIRKEMLRWGYPKDEYTDNGNWSLQPYIREARRMQGAYVMTQSNCEGKKKIMDGIGMAAYTMDSHNTNRVVINGMVKNEGDVQVGGFPPYAISYRALIPKSNECKNLLVPVCLSATHIAYGSIRMEPVFMVLAQSSAEAASQAIDRKVGIQDIDVNALQQKLKVNPLADGSPAEILIDNDDANSIVITGNWSRETNGGYGPSLLKLTADKGTKIQSVKFQPAISATRDYEIYAYFPRVENASADLNVIVHAGKKEHSATLHPNSVKIEGQTSGEWVSLGMHSFNAKEKNDVEITTQGASGAVVADAVLFIPR